MARERGFLVVIDMRGKQTCTNVRQILKALSTIESPSPVQVFIIKPDKFWEKQKASMSLGTWGFEVEMISFESLTKLVDPTQLPKSVGGTYPYDHDEWIETRLELEKWIWNITEIMEKLDSVRREICEGEQPVDVKTADLALKKSQVSKKSIFNIPVEGIGGEADRIIARISQPTRGVINPDLQATVPYISNLIDSLRLLKGDVYKLWDNRQVDLVKVYQQKLFEHDAEQMIETLRPYKKLFERTMGDVGGCASDVDRLAGEFEQYQITVQSLEVSVTQVFQQGNHLRSIGARTQIRDQK
uniref:CRAL-TRIO domain-containing protein n=2 Tax=Caenorhabditis japonica TaxID=281687 RepID=A0A8R1EUA1_CAEJA